MSKNILLPLLADGEYCSGQDLADALGVSRTAVWKQLNKLATESGLEIESVKGRGYRIRGGLDLLDEGRVRAALSDEVVALLAGLHIVDSVDSTNAEALRRLDEGISSGHLYTAEQQTAGRGRRGRHWVSPFARNLYLSLVWEFSQGAAALEGLSLAVGVAVANALQDLGLEGIRLKWPNDILHGGAKLGGILLEMTGDVAGPCQVVVGIGLNVAMPESAAGEIDQAWTDIETAANSGHPGRNEILAAILNELLPMVAAFEQTGFSAWREQWQALDAYAGQAVILDTGGRQMAGTARGVNDQGALQLETTAGVQSVFGGEISMRPAQ